MIEGENKKTRIHDIYSVKRDQQTHALVVQFLCTTIMEAIMTGYEVNSQNHHSSPTQYPAAPLDSESLILIWKIFQPNIQVWL